MKSSEIATLFPAFVASLLLTGCVSSPPKCIQPGDISKIDRTHVRVCLPPLELKAQYLQTGYGAGVGLIGAIVNAASTSIRSQLAASNVEDMRSAAEDLEVRRMYWRAVSNSIPPNFWLRPGTFEFLAGPPPAPMSEGLAREAVLDVGGQFYLSKDCRVLVMGTELRLYQPGKSIKPVALNRVEYRSPAVSLGDGYAALRHWSAGDGAAYRTAVNEGISENARLIRYALNYMKGAANANARPAIVRSKLQTEEGGSEFHPDSAGMEGWVLEETDNRMIFQSKAGTFHSLPRKEIELTYLPAKRKNVRSI